MKVDSQNSLADTLFPVDRAGVLQVFLMVTVVSAGMLIAPTAQSEEPVGICTRTSNWASFACHSEARDDFWITWGNCLNTTDKADRAECWGEGRDDRMETQELCGDQLDERKDVCDMIGEARFDPDYEPEDFVDPADIGGAVPINPLFPLAPGSMWVYEAEDETIEVTVTGDTRVIDGVLCAAVRDTVSEDDKLVEDTVDWYAQDNDGNIWYFGEISLNYDEEGNLEDIEGSWLAGTDGGKAGILMPATPMVGEVYRQEFLLGNAEDMAKIIDLAATPDLSEDNPADCAAGCLQTHEWSPIEPGHFEFKFYQAGIGPVQEFNPDTGEVLNLVEFELP